MRDFVAFGFVVEVFLVLLLDTEERVLVTFFLVLLAGLTELERVVLVGLERLVLDRVVIASSVRLVFPLVDLPIVPVFRVVVLFFIRVVLVLAILELLVSTRLLIVRSFLFLGD